MKFKISYLSLFLLCSISVAFADNPYLSELKEGCPSLFNRRKILRVTSSHQQPR